MSWLPEQLGGEEPEEPIGSEGQLLSRAGRASSFATFPSSVEISAWPTKKARQVRKHNRVAARTFETQTETML